MKLELTYDRRYDCWTLRHENTVITGPSDIVQWRSKLFEELKKLGGKRAYLLIDMAGFSLNPAIADEYGKVAKAVVGQHALGILRYGGAGLTAAAVRIEAIKNRFPSNIFADRATALQALEHVRKLPEAVA